MILWQFLTFSTASKLLFVKSRNDFFVKIRTRKNVFGFFAFVVFTKNDFDKLEKMTVLMRGGVFLGKYIDKMHTFRYNK